MALGDDACRHYFLSSKYHSSTIRRLEVNYFQLLDIIVCKNTQHAGTHAIFLL